MCLLWNKLNIPGIWTNVVTKVQALHLDKGLCTPGIFTVPVGLMYTSIYSSAGIFNNPKSCDCIAQLLISLYF